ncbi:hypothetical protein BU17DRAFT_55426 [Hysterangium stoloniferum]|nr:hypothetical protein BU17DRAFT_55426 [Hysterangium stoloniferum]
MTTGPSFPSDYGFYELQLVVLILFCVCTVVVQRYISSKTAGVPVTNGHDGPGWKLSTGETTGHRTLARKYLLVYAIVMGADWLQGPYVYSLYNEQYKFPERIVAILFITGFTSGGFTAPLVGVWADQYGRKRLCLVFCVTYTLACICTLFPSFLILLFGRAVAGLSTSILFSCFESWLMSCSSTLNLTEGELSKILGSATLINGFMATAAGVASNHLVASTHNFQTPFIASAGALVLAWFLINGLWSENFGSTGGETDLFQISRLKVAWKIVRKDLSLSVIVFTQTCFEGSMYLFVFLWVPSLQEVSPTSRPLPLGYIFASLMVAMMLGSLIYTAIVSYPPPGRDVDSSVTLHAKLSSLVCTVAAIVLLYSVTTADVRHRFWAFCIFEACVGMYYPVQGMLRSSIISDEHRATLSALSRVPLNVFVTVALLTGVSEARRLVFGGCAIVLFISAVTTALVIVRRAEMTTHLPPVLRD